VLFESDLNRSHGDEELSRVFHQGNKFVMQVEFSGPFIHGLGNHTDRGNFRNVPPASVERIHQKETSKLPALVFFVDREAPE